VNDLVDPTEKVVVMAKKVIDRRILRTRAMLQQALNSLIPKKGYEAISEAAAPANRCDVSALGDPGHPAIRRVALNVS
jgi:hypothetical protein